MPFALLALIAAGICLYCPSASGQTGSSWYVDNAVSVDGTVSVTLLKHGGQG